MYDKHGLMTVWVGKKVYCNFLVRVSMSTWSKLDISRSIIYICGMVVVLLCGVRELVSVKKRERCGEHYVRCAQRTWTDAFLSCGFSFACMYVCVGVSWEGF